MWCFRKLPVRRLSLKSQQIRSGCTCCPFLRVALKPCGHRLSLIGLFWLTARPISRISSIPLPSAAVIMIFAWRWPLARKPRQLPILMRFSPMSPVREVLTVEFRTNAHALHLSVPAWDPSGGQWDATCWSMSRSFAPALNAAMLNCGAMLTGLC